jgi:tRNA-Thr(GGU) m(6)t(6)A37 methyltransferase TsaA
MISFSPIGTIHTPYTSLHAPFQPQPHAAGEFWITLGKEYLPGLRQLDAYRYIYVVYFMDKIISPPADLLVTPPWAGGYEVGLFASRSPQRPNPIGLSIVEIKAIEGSDIIISGIDAFNGTPLLDIKPYSLSLDSKPDANDGWLELHPDKEHCLAHLLNTAHEHGELRPTSPSHPHPHATGHSRHHHD